MLPSPATSTADAAKVAALAKKAASVTGQGDDGRAKGGTEEPAQLRDARFHSVCRGQIVFRNEQWRRSHTGGAIRRGQRRRGDDQHEDGKGRTVGHDDQADRRHHRGAGQVEHDHQPAPVVPVGDDTATAPSTV